MVFEFWKPAAVIEQVVARSGITERFSNGGGESRTCCSEEGIAVSSRSQCCCSSGFLHCPPLLYTLVGHAIDFEVAWKPALEAHVLIIVSSLQCVCSLSACIHSMADNFAIGAFTLVAISASTTSITPTVSTASTTSTMPTATVGTMLGQYGSLCGCISKFLGKAGCS
jgi:hypothetical protein